MAMKSNFMAAVQRTSQDLAEVAAPIAGRDSLTGGLRQSADLPKSTDGTNVASLQQAVQPAAAALPRADGRNRRSTTVYLDEVDYMHLKLLALKDRRKLNDYLLEAVQDYMKKIADRLS